MPNAKLAALILLIVPGLHAQDPVKWTLKAPAVTYRAGEKFTVEVAAQIDSNWHIYAVTQAPGGPFPTRFSLPDGQPFRLAGAVTGPPPVVEMDANFGIQTESLAGSPIFQVPVLVAAEASGELPLHINVRYQACDESNCLPPRTDRLAVPVTLAAGGLVPQSPAGAVAFPSFIWLAMTMGALSLLTPCVFPMVPITVSYFTKNAAIGRWRAMRDAAIYAVGIVLTFTALGLALAALFGAAGINRFAASPWVNLVVTAIFLAFAVSLFGAFEMAIPSSALTSLDAISRNRGSGKVIGLLLMGLTFSLTSFTCTAPFVGTLLVMASQGKWLDPAVGMLAFSTVFAAPFFVLALAPQLVSQLPRAGGWMNSVKVVMGLLEVAAAMKFLSNADLVWRWGFFTRETVLAVWIALGVLTVLYVLGYFRMAHDSPVERIGPFRLATAAFFLAITVALVPGLFGRRLGELDSFLPPATDERDAGGAAQAVGGVRWILNDFDVAREQARRERKLMFVDFTGYTCTNCRWMEANMFPRPEVRRELERFVTVRLYTDGDGTVYQRQQEMQQSMFGTVALPLYAIVPPDGNAISTFPGLTRDPAEFLSFLRRARSDSAAR
jgi:thiol:disulfide interchange protein DsbD